MADSNPEPEAAPPSGSVFSAVADAARHPRPVWRSERAYVIATVAGIVGLGNIWRFPYMAGLHGGGTFVLAYVVCVVAIAVPLAALESAAGSIARRSPIGALRRLGGASGTAVGWAVVVMSGVILSYYLVITGWTLGYTVDAVRGQLRPFARFVDGHASLVYFLVVAAVVLVVLVRGFAAVEKLSLALVPILVVIVVGLAVYGQTLDGAGDARSFYLGVEGARLLEPSVWLAAAGQAFYSIGLGQGVLIAYGSYVPAGTDLVRSTALIAGTNAAVSIISGMLVFAVVFSFDISPATGSELSFTAFPRVFADVAGGEVLAVVFFGLLLVAGITSCLGAALMIASSVRDELDLPLRAAGAVAIATVVLVGIPSALSFTDVGLTLGGDPVLDQVDRATGSGVIVVLGILGAALIARRAPRRALAAAFGTDHRRVGHVTVGPRTIIGWAAWLPAVAAVLYLAGTVL